MNELSPSSIVLKYIENINAGDLEGLASMTSEVYKFTDIKGYVEIVRGEESVKRFWDGYFTPHPNYKIHVHHVLKGGDGVAIVGKTTGSHVPPEIEENSTILWTAEVRDGLISEWRIYSDEAYAQGSHDV